jgi:hypothetical protein
MRLPTRIERSLRRVDWRRFVDLWPRSSQSKSLRIGMVSYGSLWRMLTCPANASPSPKSCICTPEP